MPKININGQTITVEPGATVLEAARLAGIAIPSMCYLKGLPHFTSCMVCVVLDAGTGRLFPSCSALVTEGMVVETDTDEVRLARTGSLNLLISEHAGDCEAPCTTTCPAHLKIPLMIRQIGAGKTDEALSTLYDAIALPSVTGRICPAPCEKACRRGRIDEPLSICLLERFAADEGSITPGSLPSHKNPPTGKRVAIIGAGPAGLSSAFYLTRSGHDCTIFDDQTQPGGKLRYGVSENLLPPAVLDREIRRLNLLGISFRMGTRIGSHITIQDLNTEFNAIVIATNGKLPIETFASWGIETHARGIKVDEHTLQTSDKKIFAGGEVVQAGHMAVRALAHGRIMALSIDQFLKGLVVTGPAHRFESRLGKIMETESRELMKEADPAARITPNAAPDTGLTEGEATRESKRCMHCDCRKTESCKLRDYMELHLTSPLHIPADGRKPVERNTSHPNIIFEPGKCIKCGLCVRITALAGEKPGLAFLGRGFDAVVGVPFGEPLEAALGQSGGQCVKACPTGALAFKES